VTWVEGSKFLVILRLWDRQDLVGGACRFLRQNAILEHLSVTGKAQSSCKMWWKGMALGFWTFIARVSCPVIRHRARCTQPAFSVQEFLGLFDQRPRMNRRKVVPKAMTGSWPSMTDVFLPKIGLLQRAIMIHMGFRGCLVVRLRSHTHFGRWRLEAGNMCSARRALELARFRWFQVLWKLGNLSCWINPCSISYYWLISFRLAIGWPRD
jgi:hypothetical protein